LAALDLKANNCPVCEKLDQEIMRREHLHIRFRQKRKWQATLMGAVARLNPSFISF
jgi:hypothetical protein